MTTPATTKPRRRLAVCQVADAGPLESLVAMLDAVGYDCVIPDEPLRHELKRTYATSKTGTGLVLSPRELTRGMGYDPVNVPEGSLQSMEVCDLFVDVKAHQVHDVLVKRWPRLRGKVLWYRINGGEPEHVVNARGDHGDEVCPPCPVLTPNQWYGVVETSLSQTEPKVNTRYRGVPLKTHERAYCCWPPFARMGDYNPDDRPLDGGQYTPPICLIHSVKGWGYHDLVEPVRKLGVKVYGTGSPDGLIPHHEARRLLKTALCVVHLKSSDAPGYALYEALAAGCPVVCTGRLIWRCNMGSLLQPGYSCLTFDRRESHAGLTPDQVTSDANDIWYYLNCLRDVTFNRRVGSAGYRRLNEVTWSYDDVSHVDSLHAWLVDNFPL
jgi:hypothetical protein